MDQDVYGGYSKQQIGSLETDGEGEFQTSFAIESEKRFLNLKKKSTDLRQ